MTSVDRGRYGCMADGRLVVAMKARELGKGSVVVGDRVALAGDTSGSEGSLARIVRVEPRTSALRRSADDTDPAERIIVANADQLVVVCALAEPAPNLRFIDRCLVAAYDAGLDPMLVLTKADLASSRTVRAFYTPLGLPMLTTRRPLPPRTLTQLRAAVTGRISVFIGPSGVGKSTLMNTLVPAAARSTGLVNPVTGQGRHTSSSVVALPLGDDGWLIDTPGLRSFGLGHVSAARVVEAFGDLAEGTAACPSGCDHLSPDCALDEWAREHHAEARLDSLRRVLRSREGATELAWRHEDGPFGVMTGLIAPIAAKGRWGSNGGYPGDGTGPCVRSTALAPPADGVALARGPARLGPAGAAGHRGGRGGRLRLGHGRRQRRAVLRRGGPQHGAELA